jgi:hypothetical protein
MDSFAMVKFLAGSIAGPGVFYLEYGLENSLHVFVQFLGVVGFKYSGFVALATAKCVEHDSCESVRKYDWLLFSPLQSRRRIGEAQKYARTANQHSVHAYGSVTKLTS